MCQSLMQAALLILLQRHTVGAASFKQFPQKH